MQGQLDPGWGSNYMLPFICIDVKKKSGVPTPGPPPLDPPMSMSLFYSKY